MILWLSIMVLGLLLTLAGIILTFIAEPPSLNGMDSEKVSKRLAKKPLNIDEIAAEGGETERTVRLKFRFSRVGVVFLIVGAGLQLFAGIGQLVLFICKK